MWFVWHIWEIHSYTMIVDCLSSTKGIPCRIITLTFVTHIKSFFVTCQIWIGTGEVLLHICLAIYRSITIVWIYNQFFLWLQLILWFENIWFNNISAYILFYTIVLAITTYIIILTVRFFCFENKYVISQCCQTVLDNKRVTQRLACALNLCNILQDCRII